MLKTLSIVIPVYNEEKRLSITFKELKKDSLFLYGFRIKEVIFVDDGSCDSTKRIVHSVKAELEKKTKASVKLISYKQNRGKGYAVKRGMLAATSDYALLMDADISTPLSELRKFNRLSSNFDVVIGTRKNGKSTVKVAQPIYRQLLGRVFTLLSQIILNTWVTDFTCGFKLFNRESRERIFSRTRIDRWGYDSEVIFLASKLGYSMTEKAVVWRNKEGSRVSVVKDAVNSLVELFKVRYFDYSGKYETKKAAVSLA